MGKGVRQSGALQNLQDLQNGQMTIGMKLKE